MRTTFCLPSTEMRFLWTFYVQMGPPKQPKGRKPKVKLWSFLERTRTENLRLLTTGPSLLCSRIFGVRWSSQTHCSIHLRSVRSSWFLEILCNKAGVFTKLLEALCSNAQVARLNTTTFCGYDESAFTIFLSSLELEDLKNKDLNCNLDFLKECVLTRASWIHMYVLCLLRNTCF